MKKYALVMKNDLGVDVYSVGDKKECFTYLSKLQNDLRGIGLPLLSLAYKVIEVTDSWVWFNLIKFRTMQVKFFNVCLIEGSIKISERENFREETYIEYSN